MTASQSSDNTSKKSSGFRKRLLTSRPVRGLLKRIYTGVYRLLFEDGK